MLSFCRNLFWVYPWFPFIFSHILTFVRQSKAYKSHLSKSISLHTFGKKNYLSGRFPQICIKQNPPWIVGVSLYFLRYIIIQWLFHNAYAILFLWQTLNVRSQNSITFLFIEIRLEYVGLKAIYFYVSVIIDRGNTNSDFS